MHRAIDLSGQFGPLPHIGEVFDQTGMRTSVGRIDRQRQPQIAFEFLDLRRPRQVKKPRCCTLGTMRAAGC